MGKQSKVKGKPPVSDGLDPIDPALLFYTHSKIRPSFSGCGKRIEDTIAEITAGALRVEELPFITVLAGGDGHFYALNNRRLYVLKHLRAIGFLEPLNTVRVRIKTPLPKEMKKYSPQRCSMTCTIMKERPRTEHDDEEGEDKGSEDGDELSHAEEELGVARSSKEVDDNRKHETASSAIAIEDMGGVSKAAEGDITEGVSNVHLNVEEMIHGERRIPSASAV